MKVKWWDTFLHTLNGIVCAAVGLSMVRLLNASQRIDVNLSPVFLAIVAVSFSITIGVVWEFFEFGMDHIIGTDMQKDMFVTSISTVALDPEMENHTVCLTGISSVQIVSNEGVLEMGSYLDLGLMDTMKDLLVTFAGSICFNVFAALYVKRYGEQSFIDKYLLQLN